MASASSVSRPRGRPKKLTSSLPSFWQNDPPLPDISTLYQELGYPESKGPRHTNFYGDLNTYLSAFISSNGMSATEKLDPKTQQHLDTLSEITQSFLNNEGRGRLYWPDDSTGRPKRIPKYSKNKMKIENKVFQLFLLLNWDLHRRNCLFEIQEESSLDQNAGYSPSNETPTSETTFQGVPREEVGANQESHLQGSQHSSIHGVQVPNPSSPTKSYRFRTLRSLQPFVEDVVDDYYARSDELAQSSPNRRRRLSRIELDEQVMRKRRKGKQVARQKPPRPSTSRRERVPNNADHAQSLKFPSINSSDPNVGSSQSAESQASSDRASPFAESSMGNKADDLQSNSMDNHRPKSRYYPDDPRIRIPGNGLTVDRELEIDVDEAGPSHKPISYHAAQRSISRPPSPPQILQENLICSVFVRPFLNKIWTPEKTDFASLSRLLEVIPIEVEYHGLEFILRTPEGKLSHEILKHDEPMFRFLKRRFSQRILDIHKEYEFLSESFMIELEIAPMMQKSQKSRHRITR